MARLTRGSVWLVVLWCSAPAGCGDDEASDEDLIEKFIEDITGKVDDGYVDRALGYLDTTQFPVDVMVPGHQGVYDEAQTPKLVEAFRREMRQRFQGVTIKVRSKKFEIDGERAEVRLQLLSSAFGMARWEFTLQKGTTGWKVSRVVVIR